MFFQCAPIRQNFDYSHPDPGSPRQIFIFRPDCKTSWLNSSQRHPFDALLNSSQRHPSDAPRGHSNMQVYKCVKKKRGKGGLFQHRTQKAGNSFRASKMPFSGKRGSFVNTYSNSLDSNLFRGSNFEAKFLFGDDFCIMTKTCSGVNISKRLFTHVYTCISKWSPPHTWHWADRTSVRTFYVRVFCKFVIISFVRCIMYIISQI